jgi:hypothetical protein
MIKMIIFKYPKNFYKEKEMRYFTVVILAAILFSACSSTKQIERVSINQAPCANEEQITDPKTFTGETADNLQVYQQGDVFFATMNVRTYCNAKIDVNVEVSGDQLRLKLNRTEQGDNTCVCNINVTTSYKNIEPGNYTVMVMNAAGSQVLAQQDILIK